MSGDARRNDTNLLQQSPTGERAPEVDAPPDEGDVSGDDSPGDEYGDRTHLVEELRSHQVELEMQNQELRRAQSDLRMATERYQALFDRAPVGYVILDRQGRVEEANLKAATLVGVDRGRLVGKPFVIYLVPENHAPFFGYLSEVFAAGGEQRSRVFRLITRDRSERWIAFDGRVETTLRDEPVCYATASDVTDDLLIRRRMEESEQRYRLIVESVNDPVYLSEIDPTGLPGRFVAVNGRAVQALGYSEEELLSMRAMEINEVDSRKSASAIMQNLRMNGRGVYEVIHRRKDGTSFPVEVSARIVVVDGETRILSVARDISERKQAERRVQHLRRVLSTITRVDRILIRERDPKRIVSQTVEAVGREGGYTRFWIVLRGPDGKVDEAAEFGIGEPFREYIDKLNAGWRSTCVRTLDEDPTLPHFMGHGSDQCEDCPLVDAYGDATPVALALRRGESLVGYLVANVSGDEQTLEQELDLLRGLAENLSVALSTSES